MAHVRDEFFQLGDLTVLDVAPSNDVFGVDVVLLDNQTRREYLFTLDMMEVGRLIDKLNANI